MSVVKYQKHAPYQTKSFDAGLKVKYLLPILLIVFFLIIAVWGFCFEPYEIKIENVELNIKDIPPSFDNLRIVHLSDFHSQNFGRREKDVLTAVKKLNPDFIFITGDIVDWTTRNFDSVRLFWERLGQNYPGRVFGVFGNHEHRNAGFAKLEKILEESGIEILNNESRKIELNSGFNHLNLDGGDTNNDFIYLIGVDDPHDGYDDITKALKGLDSNSFKILLAHSPEIFRKIKSYRINKNLTVNLVLTGHTHGGQINIPFLVDLILPLKYDKQYKRGLFKEDSIFMYVNRGIGPSGLPFRFNSFPEITLIKLSR